MTRNQLEEKFNCEIFKDSCFESGNSYWVCMSLENKEYLCDGWTLKEVEEKLRDKFNLQKRKQKKNANDKMKIWLSGL